MSLKNKSILAAVVVLALAAATLGIRNTPLSNLFYALSYERTLDAYAQTDTTVSNITAAIDANGRRARLFSAFFGLDDATPGLAGLVVCEGASGKDGMPVVFSHELDVSTVEPGDFKITTSSGVAGEVTCLTLAPADDAGELRTVLLVGQLGSVDDQPMTVEVVGNVLSRDNSVNFKGTSVAVTPLEAGPSLVEAQVVPELEWSLGNQGTSMPFGGGTGCPTGTKQIVRVTWNGGVTKPGGVDADDVERALYTVTHVREDQSTYESAPFALADLRDGDNNHKLCLNTADRVASVSFPAGHLTDPRDDLNPATSVNLL